MNHSLVKSSRVLCSAIALTLSAAASGAELDYGLLAGASYSDNVARTAADEEASGAAVAGFDLRGERTTGRLLYDVFADVEYRDYFEDNVESQEFGRAIAQGSYAFVPETFVWRLYGSFDQVREDLLRPAAPDNLEDVITFSTGPQLTVSFADAFEAQAEAHYTMASYSERDIDTTTAGAVLTLGRRLSERTYLGLGASHDDVSYDVARGRIAPDYERREYFLRFNTEGARTTLDADVGYTQLTGVGVDDDSPMARARLTRRLTPYVSGFVGYTREFPTSADSAFTPEPAQGDLIEDSSIVSAAPRENESAELGLVMTRQRTSAMLVFVRRSEKTLGPLSQEREFDDLTASFNRMITTRSSFGLYGIYTKEDLDDVVVGPLLVRVNGEAKETVFGANLELALGRSLGLEFRVEHRERDSDLGVGTYKELSGGLFLRYGSARRQAREAAAP